MTVADPAMGSMFAILAQADGVQKAVAITLLGMSIVTWYLVFAKSWQMWTAMQRGQRFRAGAERGGGVAAIDASDAEEGYCAVAQAVRAAAANRARAASADDAREIVALAAKRATRRATERLQRNLSALASIGATAPFIGLFGTVWGIYHALIGIGISGQASIDRVAGPVGEALIMTAFGLAVAIPAVLAYNALVRASRRYHADLEEFAQDLYVESLGQRAGAATTQRQAPGDFGAAPTT